LEFAVQGQVAQVSVQSSVQQLDAPPEQQARVNVPPPTAPSISRSERLRSVSLLREIFLAICFFMNVSFLHEAVPAPAGRRRG
jgi:hypothetical protein